MKDEQKVHPSESQLYSGITSIPWIVKPLWGLLTDAVPILGRQRGLSALCYQCPYLMVSPMNRGMNLAITPLFQIIQSKVRLNPYELHSIHLCCSSGIPDV
ncbi:hypothetical protein K7X08_006891 [Anisodus acutangulus]|uniref:Uncharacterized protein n=1 Tax=Anisodus acutangulus TaxID=402998 RepID=A0A9Q1QXR8_9SOLA|nr:hypothetical protein K7X08_006891 [Anisodus acutangulus]